VDRSRLARGSAKWAAYPPDVLPAWVAEMDFALAEPVKGALLDAVERDDTGYLGPDLLGVPEAFAAFAARRLGWEVDPEQVSVATDVMVGIEELLQVVTEPGAGVVITPPVYPPFFGDVRHAGRAVVEAPLAGDAFDLGAIERALEGGAQAVLISNPHNPLGRVWTAAELGALADVADQHGAWVLSDEIHGPLALDGAYTPYLTVSERGFALTSASKAFNLAGLKLGLIVTAGGEARDLAARLGPEAHWRAGYLGAVAAEAAFREGDEWLDDVLETLDGNRRLLAELLSEQLPDVGYTPPQASFLTWLDCRALGLGDDPAAAFLERGRVALSRGLDFGAQGAGFARLNIGTSPERVEEAVSRMAAASTR
jgi:cysteine-S-conjugate beta-lyase